MVRITNNLYQDAYEYIKRDSSEGNCIVFVAADIDSICAVRIFQSLLKTDIIPHKIVPVSGHKDLEDANEKLISKDENLRSIVMINCGGSELIANLFTAPPETKVYVIDSHRPLLLDNLLSENNHICVFDDESQTTRVEAAIEAYEKLIAYEDEESDEDNNDQDSENEELDEDDRPIDDRPRQRRRLNESTRLSKRNERRHLNSIVANYYGNGSFYANSVSGVVYELAQQLGKTNNELLWLAIVGVTSQYIFEKMDTFTYAKYLEMFKDDRARLNIDRTEDGSLQNANSIVIKSEDEYRFIMFRHWSLYDSMYHSGYVSSKLGVWKDAGRKRLNNMFAKMGFSLQQCQQIYTHMDMDLKQILRDKIEVVAPLYGLTDICFPSFTRTYGWECCLSASDVVYSLSTLLETSPAAAIQLGTAVNIKETEEESFTDNEDEDPKDDSGKTAEMGRLNSSNGYNNHGLLGSERSKWWMKNFYAAYDALNGNSPSSLLRGLKLCMKTQKTIVRQGTSIIEKKMVKIFKNFRFVNVRNGPDLPIFQHPSALTKLGLYLIDAYREHGKKNLPIVLSSLDEKHGTCLLVALTGAASFGEIRKNKFNMAFEEAAENTKARISFDSFDPSIIQVLDADVEHFIEALSKKR
ncbi:CDC45 family [Cokeromyces recurvatus]|uniref:CDC45 family n=1 Tax=Cokeromyces recurvatus TaxID=90255 RepID=UPI00222044CB|nr:CDC45 family [Cokeromyces recurvatus]KAI7902091.1 CDC45 family [Cokeromyces recurvatus]